MCALTRPYIQVILTTPVAHLEHIPRHIPRPLATVCVHFQVDSWTRTSVGTFWVAHYVIQSPQRSSQLFGMIVSDNTVNNATFERALIFPRTSPSVRCAAHLHNLRVQATGVKTRV
ncbi:hypothetical protein K438DRAFT_402862 [Mycena galopus ATCC 62051]|nr:hypothetical protein K438DRAFT_402862 [Mycena galopus ATCC 62051]